jgi:hypothetical protein
VQKLARAILNKDFLMHPHQNAFDRVDFGANSHGVLVATMDDDLHSCKSGSLLNLIKVAYHGLTTNELSQFEQIIQSKVCRSKFSASSDYPHGTVKSGFGRLTLCSH